MKKAVFRKKWAYGDPNTVKLEEGDWFRWVRFVNIIADDHMPNTEIGTSWDGNVELYGYSLSYISEKEPDHVSGAVNVKEAEDALEEAEAIDFRINTHQDLLPIALRVMKWIERREEKERRMLAAMRELVDGLMRS